MRLFARVGLVLALVSLVLLASCAQGGTPAQTVGENYLMAYKNLDFEQAEKNATAESREFLRQQATFVSGMSQEKMKLIQDEILRIVRTEEKGETARVIYTLTSPNDLSPAIEEYIDLVKVASEWKVVASVNPL